LSSTIWGKPPQSESPRRRRKFILHSLHHASTNDVGSKPLYAQSCRLTLNDLIIGIACPLTTTQSQLRSGLQDTFERVIPLFYFSTISADVTYVHGIELDRVFRDLITYNII
jgi:hypothetical protein